MRTGTFSANINQRATRGYPLSPILFNVYVNVVINLPMPLANILPLTNSLTLWNPKVHCRQDMNKSYHPIPGKSFPITPPTNPNDVILPHRLIFGLRRGRLPSSFPRRSFSHLPSVRHVPPTIIYVT